MPENMGAERAAAAQTNTNTNPFGNSDSDRDRASSGGTSDFSQRPSAMDNLRNAPSTFDTLGDLDIDLDVKAGGPTKNELPTSPFTESEEELTKKVEDALKEDDHCLAYKPPTDDKVISTMAEGASRFGTMANLTYQWATGTGPVEHAFVDDEIAFSLQDAEIVNQGRDYWYDSVNEGKKTIYDGVTDFKGGQPLTSGNFGLVGLFKAGTDPVEQFIGSYCLEMRSDGKELTYTAYNTSSFESFAYGVGGEYERTESSFLRGDSGIGGNTRQTYEFSEPIDFDRLTEK